MSEWRKDMSLAWWQMDVHEFHRALGLGIGNYERPAMQNGQLRANLVLEEAIEFCESVVGTTKAVLMLLLWANKLMDKNKPHPGGDLVGAVDAIADELVVCLGSAVEFGVDIKPIFKAVMDSNMAKSGGVKDENGKLQKPAGWKPPDIEGELKKQGWG